MEFDKFNPDTDKNIGFRNIDIEEKYDVYKTNSIYFNLDIKVKLFNKSDWKKLPIGLLSVFL